ncbi:MAG: sodium:solute symporter, partial [Sediminibacterium sp.]|nr:sodium:solute symporter [Sediminibacterium sp.]
MSAPLLFLFVVLYFLVLLAVAKVTGKNSNNMSFFIGNKNSNWMLVAFGMIGTSLSGVTFVSVPGAVGKDGFHYLQITIGYLIGYFTIAYVLLPIYYKMNLTSIYNYLEQRLGFGAYKTGASFFILSRTLGATARLYLVVKILQVFILDNLHVPFWATTLVILAMILLYTYEGGVKTIVYTDTLQTSGMLLGLIICSIYILSNLHLSVGDALVAMQAKGIATVFNPDVNAKSFFLKQIIGGAFITLTMTGLDQEMMQKNISVKNLKDAQKNMITIGFTMLFVISLFLFLGGLLHLYAEQLNVTAVGDDLFPTLALQHMPPYLSIIFILALISALFPSADGAITALTSSFCIDIVGMQRNNQWDEAKKKKIRQRIHLGFAFLFLIIVLVFKWIDNKSIIDLLLKIASYTYGPLLGLFAFGILTKRSIKDNWAFLPCFVAPLLCLLLDYLQPYFFGSAPTSFRIGQELLIINGLFTFLGLFLISSPNSEK